MFSITALAAFFVSGSSFVFSLPSIPFHIPRHTKCGHIGHVFCATLSLSIRTRHGFLTFPTQTPKMQPIWPHFWCLGSSLLILSMKNTAKMAVSFKLHYSFLFPLNLDTKTATKLTVIFVSGVLNTSSLLLPNYQIK